MEITSNSDLYDAQSRYSRLSALFGSEEVPPSLFGVQPFAKDTLNNLYVNQNVHTPITAKAQNFLGKQEVSRSQYNSLSASNRQYTQYELIGNDPYYLNSSWCALAVDTLMKKCGYNIIDSRVDTVESNGKGRGVYATVDEFVAWGRLHSNYHAINYSYAIDEERQLNIQMKSMHEGDFIIWKRGRRSHIGVIESVNLKKGTITTLEGNANANGKNNRDGFIRKTYTIKELIATGYSGYIDNSKLFKKA